MSKFRTVGPAIHGTAGGYQVYPLLEVTDEPPAPMTSEVITFLVLDPSFQIVFTGALDACIEEAEVLNAPPAP